MKIILSILAALTLFAGCSGYKVDSSPEYDNQFDNTDNPVTEVKHHGELIAEEGTGTHVGHDIHGRRVSPATGFSNKEAE